MALTGSNVVKVGSFNQSVILDAIRRSDGISRIELAERTSLVPQTVTNICRRLLADGIIYEAGKTSGSVGKPRTLLRLRGDGRFAVGVLLDPAQITIVLLDLTGTVEARVHLPTPPPDDPARVIRTISEQVGSLIAGAGVDPANVLGIGVAAPGPLDLEAGTILNPPYLPGWDRVFLRDDLASVTGLPVILEKDVVAAVVAKTWQGAEAVDALGVIYVGTGIGVGVSLGGEVIRGASGNAGEIGHIVVDPSGPRCACGQRGCVAVVSSPTALVERLGDGASPTDLLGSFADLVEAPSDTEHARIVDAALDGIARLATVVVDLYDLDHLVFGGPFWEPLRDRFREFSLPRLQDAPVARRIHGIRIDDSVLGEDLGAIGAGSLVLDRLLSPRTSSLVFDPTG